MKKTLMVLCGALLWAGVAFAQEKGKAAGKKDKVKIKVEKSVNGEKEVFEKEYDTSGMTSQERDDLIGHVQDSLGLKSGQSGRFKIMIDDGDFEFENRNGEDDFVFGEKPRVRVYSRSGRNGQGFNEFELDMNRLKDRMKDAYAAFPKGFENMHRWDDHVFSAVDGTAIRGLDVFPNRPDIETLNVKFYAPKEGDVSITVVDLKGNVVSKSEVKSLKGEYVGQVRLKKAEPGVYFVIVAQGEDGISKKVKL